MESVQERMERLGTKEKMASFIQKEKQPYKFKRRYAQIRAEEFARECDGRGLNYHVSVGGLDSIVLHLFLNEVCGIDVPGVSASSLEDKSIQIVMSRLARDARFMRIFWMIQMTFIKTWKGLLNG